MPRPDLGEKRIEMGKQEVVRKVPATRESVGHDIDWARNVSGLKTVAEVALMKRRYATKVGGRGVSRSGAAKFTGDGSGVVR